jgi:hypothetical protein
MLRKSRCNHPPFKDVIDVSIARMNILLKRKKKKATNAEIKRHLMIKMITYMNNDDSRFFVNRDGFPNMS